MTSKERVMAVFSHQISGPYSHVVRCVSRFYGKGAQLSEC